MSFAESGCIPQQSLSRDFGSRKVWWMRNVSNALFKSQKASEDQAKHISNILSTDQSSNRSSNLKEEIKKEFPVNDMAEEKRELKEFFYFRICQI